VGSERWLLPEGIEDLLPEQAAQLERLRRDLLDLFHRWGYDMVVPPLVEFLDSLLVGTDLDFQTFKLTDQLSGQLLGVRADMTPQVARMDAHRMSKQQGPVRLCYQGEVLHTRGDGLGGSRSFTQIGAELYGHAGVESDVEVLSLMLEALKQAGIQDLYVDLGHVGIFRALAQSHGLTEEQESQLFDALQRKAVPDMEALLADFGLVQQASEDFTRLVWLHGGRQVLDEARQGFASHENVLAALDQLQQVADAVSDQHGDLELHFDLAELRGYHYHTGVVFAAYQLGQGAAIAQGGRYNDIGQAFGRARPATGFSADLRALLALGAKGGAPTSDSIFAPAQRDVTLQEKVKALRAAGERVVCALPGQTGGAREAGCSRELVAQDGDWKIQTIK
jgi:ATP phosphoribosyltransferase regulatory subunit